jgi:hypothetical protein
MIDEKKFKRIIKLASRPMKQASGKSVKKKAYDYSGKRTRQHSAVDTSGKRSGKCR